MRTFELLFLVVLKDLGAEFFYSRVGQNRALGRGKNLGVKKKNPKIVLPGLTDYAECPFFDSKSLSQKNNKDPHNNKYNNPLTVKPLLATQQQ